MTLNRINNVVLYAKNFYIHTKDVVSDMFNMVQADHPELEITNKETLREVMLSDYNDWNDTYMLKHYPHIRYMDAPGVAWTSDSLLSLIYGILSRYSTYVDMFSSELKPPVYSETRTGFQPQRRLQRDYDIFRGCSTMDECTEKAAAYLTRTTEQRFKDMVSALRENLNHDKIKELSEKPGVSFSYDGPETFDEIMSHVDVQSAPDCYFKDGLEAVLYRKIDHVCFNVYPVWFEFHKPDEFSWKDFTENCYRFVVIELNRSGFYTDYKEIDLSYSLGSNLENLHDSVIQIAESLDKETPDSKYSYVSIGYIKAGFYITDNILRFMIESVTCLSDFVIEEKALHNHNIMVDGEKY